MSSLQPTLFSEIINTLLTIAVNQENNQVRILLFLTTATDYQQNKIR